MEQQHAKLILDGQEHLLNIREGTFEGKYLEVETLYAKTGIRMLDPSFKSTASCESKITYIHGEKGILLYRGYPIEELAEKKSYLDVCYLLFHGELPTEAQAAEMRDEIGRHTLVHEQLRYFFNGFRRDAHPMAIMCGVMGALSAFYHDSMNIYDKENRRFSAIRLLAKVPTIAAMCFKYSIGQPFIYPHPEYSYVENFLHMLFGIPNRNERPNPLAVKALETILTLHADHEQNASTSTVRLAGSSGANPFACMAAGIAALWGPAHGGANEAVIKMLKEIGDVSRIGLYIHRAKDKSDGFKLMGFGHRVYKNFDPRAKIIKSLYEEILAQSEHHNDPLFDIAKELERIALSDEYFMTRKLYPNVDFYSGLILKRLGIPTEMFTVIFVVARMIGWISQWNEMLSEPPLTIGRPQQIYTGANIRHL